MALQIRQPTLVEYDVLMRQMRSLGDRSRVEIIKLIAQHNTKDCGTLTVEMICEKLGVNRATLCYHLRCLLFTGLIGMRREGLCHCYYVQQDVVARMIGDLQQITGTLDQGSEPRSTGS